MYIRKKKNLDFLRAERQKNGREAAKRWIRYVMFLIPLIVFFGFLQAYLYYVEKIGDAEREILAITGYINEESTMKKRGKLKKLYQNMELLERYEEESRAEENPEDRAVLPGNFMGWIQNVMSDRVELVCDEYYPILYEDGVLQFTAQTDVPAEAPSYVERLEEEGNFDRVIYSGLERRAGLKGKEWQYLFSVKCRLKPTAQYGGGS